MIIIPGWLISILTAPGVIAHEFAHRLFCDLAKIPVYEVCYFRVGDPSGYVVHGPSQSLKDSLLISIGPLIVNTILCSLLTFSAAFPIFILKAGNYNIVFGFLMWIGFSIGMHAFPSNDDMANLVLEVKNTKQRGPLLIFVKFFAGLLKVANFLRIFWFDAIYAFCISMLLPWIMCSL